MALDVRGFVAPVDDYAGLYKIGDTIQRNNERKMELDYRHQKDAENDQWRRLSLIQDLTDLSKHQTGNDVADAMGNKQAADIFQKYTQAASSMSPMELQANIQKDMSGVISAMDAMKNELSVTDEQIKDLKTKYPNIDINSLAKNIREDVLNRRVDKNGGFANPLTVPQSSVNLGDPDFLSKYVTGDKTLRNYFQNPQGMEEMSVFKGNPNSYTKYTAKVPAFKKTNYDPATLNNGFLKDNVEPSLEFKSSKLPSDALPSSNGKPFEMMDKDVYEQLGGQEKIELIAATRRQFPNYDEMNPTEKEYAQRNVLLNTAKAFDQTQFHPTDIKTPSASLLKLMMGGNGSGGGDKSSEDVRINDVYSRIYDNVKRLKDYGEKQTPVSLLDADGQSVVMDAVNKGKTGDNQLQMDDVWVKLSDNNELLVFDNAGNLKTTLTKVGTNIGKQPSVKEKREVVSQGQSQNKSTYKIKGKTYSEDELLNMGYKLDQIKPYKQ